MYYLGHCSLIGFISYKIIDISICDDNSNKELTETEEMIWKIAQIIGIPLCIIETLHFFMFKFSKLADIQN